MHGEIHLHLYCFFPARGTFSAFHCYVTWIFRIFTVTFARITRHGEFFAWRRWVWFGFEIGMRDFVWISFSVFLHSTKWMEKRSCWKYQSVIKAVKPQIKKSSKGINVSTQAKCSTASLCTPFPGIYTAAILYMEKDVGKISGALYPKTWERGENGQINLWGKGGVMSCSKSFFSSK